MKNSNTVVAIWFAAFSAVTFLAFGFDKWRAGRSGKRISELTLVMLGALGGWAGGCLGMMVFRHKTAKWTFKLKYTLALIPFAVEVWAWWNFLRLGAPLGHQTIRALNLAAKLMLGNEGEN